MCKPVYRLGAWSPGHYPKAHSPDRGSETVSTQETLLLGMITKGRCPIFFGSHNDEDWALIRFGVPERAGPLRLTQESDILSCGTKMLLESVLLRDFYRNGSASSTKEYLWLN